jgi:hypothetical protein
LAEDVAIGEANGEAVLVGLVLVFVLSNELVSLAIISLAL